MTDSLKVLMVEDSEDDTVLILRVLQRDGFTVVWNRVETAKLLYAALESDSWDVVISDYHLPGFDAPAALKIVKQSQPNLPFIVVSGTIGEASAVELMKAGAQDYLMKSNLARLPEVVRREVREARARLEHQQATVDLDQTKERLQLAIEGSGIGLWDWSVQTGAMTCNDHWSEMLGYPLQELKPMTIETWRQYTHPEDWQKATLALEKHFRQESQVYECELRMRHQTGSWVWGLMRGKVVEWSATGFPTRMTGTYLDISDRKQAELRLELQNSILERIARAEPLLDILDALVQTTEEQLDGGFCSILLCDQAGQYLYHGVAPHLPDAYNQALGGVPIGEGSGSCGTAAFRRQPVIVSDIATDSLWQDYRELALANGLQSCWSTPVISSDGSVVATFAVYHPTIHSPQKREFDVITLVANIAKIAIEREYATKSLEQLNRELEARVLQRTAALQQSEARLLEAQQVARLGSWELDVQTQTIIWSAEVFKIFGFDPDSTAPTYQQLLHHFPLDEQIRLNQLVNRAISKGEPYATDFQIIRTDHSSGYIFAKAEPIYNSDGKVIRLFGIAMDISDRKAMQEALQRSEARARATLLALPDLIFRVNSDGQYLDFLSVPSGANSVDPYEAIGKRLDEILPLERTENKYTALQKALTTQSVQSYEQEILIDGELRYEEVRVAPCGNEEAVFFVRDISDRKQAEMQLQRTNEELARATRLKDEFLANMSHELRTPLNAILGMAEGLQDQIFGPLNDAQLIALQTIERSGSHLLELINDILDVAKIESGQVELNCAPMSVAPLCQSSLSFIKQQALKKSIHLEIKLPAHLPDLLIDERRMRQVLINLLNNAVKFTPEGGRITVEVNHHRSPGNAQDSSPQSFLRIAIIDTGIGIAPEHLHKLFQPFVQIDSALNRQYTGTGLGLSLVKRIVELHGGQVGVTSEIGVGSCFTIDLPCTVPAETLPEVGFSAESGFGLSQSGQAAEPLILFVEDNEANIMTISSYLSGRGYRIVLARDGQEAVAAVQTESPALILMDIQMPGLDGLEAMRQIRTQAGGTDVPIIALTALAMVGDREKCLAAGATEYLTKPVKLKQLAEVIQQFIFKSSEARRNKAGLT